MCTINEVKSRKGLKKECSTCKETLCCSPQDAVTKLLIQTKAAGWKANDWNLKKPDWNGKMRLVGLLDWYITIPNMSVHCTGYHGKGRQDQTGGERQRQPVPRMSSRDIPRAGHSECDRLQQVSHCRWVPVRLLETICRYFVIKVTEDGKNVYLGLGFEDRADSFDLNSTLHDYFKGLLVSSSIRPGKVLDWLLSCEGGGEDWAGEGSSSWEARPGPEAGGDHQSEYKLASQEERPEQVRGSERWSIVSSSSSRTRGEYPCTSITRHGQT